MHVTINRSLCEGNGICAQLAPTVFRLDEEGEMHLLDETPPDSLRDQVAAAVRSCPRGASSIGA